MVFTVKQTQDKGRGLFTSCEVPEGTTVLSEAPVLLTVAQAALQQVCAQCLRQLPSPGAPTSVGFQIHEAL
jgi:hypothetical protein